MLASHSEERRAREEEEERERQERERIEREEAAKRQVRERGGVHSLERITLIMQALQDARIADETSKVKAKWDEDLDTWKNEQAAKKEVERVWP